MEDHDHTDGRAHHTDAKLLRSGVTIKTTADRDTGTTVGNDDAPTQVIDFVEVTVSVVSAHGPRINLNAAAVAVDAALRAQFDAPAEPGYVA